MSAHERHIKPTWLTLVYNKATPSNLSLPLNSNLGEWIPKCDSRGIHTDLNPPKKMPRALMLAWVAHIEKPKGFKPAQDFMSNCLDDSLAYRDCKSNPPWHKSNSRTLHIHVNTNPFRGSEYNDRCDLLLTLKTWIVWATSIQQFPRSFFTHLSCHHSFSKHHPTQVSI
jgi:hypothetical protein